MSDKVTLEERKWMELTYDIKITVVNDIRFMFYLGKDYYEISRETSKNITRIVKNGDLWVMDSPNSLVVKQALEILKDEMNNVGSTVIEYIMAFVKGEILSRAK